MQRSVLVFCWFCSGVLIAQRPAYGQAEELTENLQFQAQDALRGVHARFMEERFAVAQFSEEEIGLVYYDLRSVVEHIDDARAGVWEVLTHPELEALQNFATNYFAEAMSALDVSTSLACPRLCVTEGSTEEAYGIVAGGNEAILELESFLFDLTVTSEPEEARVKLFLRNHELPRRTAVTEDVFVNLARGRYLLVVEKLAFQPWSSWLDFIRDPRDRLVCELKPLTAPAGPGESVCRLQ